MQALTNDRGRKMRRTLLGMVLGGLAGFAGAFALLRMANAGMLGVLAGSQMAALFVALIYLLMGLAVGIGLASPRMGAQFLNVEDAAEIAEQRAMLAPSAAACVLLAFTLAALALAGPDGVLTPVGALIVVALTLGASAWLTLRSASHADELMRGVMRDGAAASFYLTFAVLGGWAVLAWLGLSAAPAMLDVITLLYALTLLGSFWVVGRRGMMIR